MKVVIVYESMYGNTHHVASAIGVGFHGVADVSVVAVEEASQQLVDASDLLVVGGPTHVHGMSRPSTRKAAVEALAKNEALELDPDAEGPGLRAWFQNLLHRAGRAAAFDTRMHGPPLLTGRGIERHRAPAHEARVRDDRTAGELHRDEGDRAGIGRARSRRCGACTSRAASSRTWSRRRRTEPGSKARSPPRRMRDARDAPPGVGERIDLHLVQPRSVAAAAKGRTSSDYELPRGSVRVGDRRRRPVTRCAWMRTTRVRSPSGAARAEHERGLGVEAQFSIVEHQVSERAAALILLPPLSVRSSTISTKLGCSRPDTRKVQR